METINFSGHGLLRALLETAAGKRDFETAYPTPRFVRDGLGECARHHSPDVFTEDETRTRNGRRAREEARLVCAACPFSDECLAWAKATGRSGIYGGEWLRDGEPRTEKALPRNRKKVRA